MLELIKPFIYRDYNRHLNLTFITKHYNIVHLLNNLKTI